MGFWMVSNKKNIVLTLQGIILDFLGIVNDMTIEVPFFRNIIVLGSLKYSGSAKFLFKKNTKSKQLGYPPDKNI